jgi:hypothetical protein
MVFGYNYVIIFCDCLGSNWEYIKNRSRQEEVKQRRREEEEKFEKNMNDKSDSNKMVVFIPIGDECWLFRRPRFAVSN